jgi:hypothetical protein
VSFSSSWLHSAWKLVPATVAAVLVPAALEVRDG